MVRRIPPVRSLQNAAFCVANEAKFQSFFANKQRFWKIDNQIQRSDGQAEAKRAKVEELLTKLPIPLPQLLQILSADNEDLLDLPPPPPPPSPPLSLLLDVVVLVTQFTDYKDSEAPALSDAVIACLFPPLRLLKRPSAFLEPQDVFSRWVKFPKRFTDMCGFSPDKFAAFHAIISPWIVLSQNWQPNGEPWKGTKNNAGSWRGPMEWIPRLSSQGTLPSKRCISQLYNSTPLPRRHQAPFCQLSWHGWHSEPLGSFWTWVFGTCERELFEGQRIGVDGVFMGTTPEGLTILRTNSPRDSSRGTAAT